MKKGDEDAGYRGRGNPDTRLRYALWQKDGTACSADITYSRWHGMSGTPLEVLMQLGGWSELRMVMRYATLTGYLGTGHVTRTVFVLWITQAMVMFLPKRKNKLTGRCCK